MKQIVKVIFHDGTEHEITEFEPLELSDITSKNYGLIWRFRRQFANFEDDILNYLEPDNVKDYAIHEFDLMDEDDAESSLDDFSEAELMQELKERKSLFIKHSILTEDFENRFLRIIEKENSILLDNLLTEFEQKLNL